MAYGILIYNSANISTPFSLKGVDVIIYVSTAMIGSVAMGGCIRFSSHHGDE